MLKIYNTATRKKEEFKPKNPEEVTMYNCGLTVYDRPHIGNLRAYTMADIMRRSLEYLGYQVKQVQNFTDVGHETLTEEQKAKIQGEIEVTDTDEGIDRMEKAARKEGLTPWQVADHYIDLAMKDFHDMNFLEPFKRPRATEHIPEQIDLIKKLLEKGYAYITNSAIYYDTSKFPEYWEFTGQKPEDKKVAVRSEIETDTEKKHPSDFRLWQFNRPDHTMQWDFEWQGKNYRGYPGWHIECSAMANKYLGNPIDIHTGGADHIPVHHPNEIAQSEPIFGKPFVSYWYHNSFLNVDNKRMGKSLGNAYTLDDLKQKGFESLDLRYFYLTADFRKPQNFTWEALESARSARKRLVEIIRNLITEIEDTPADDDFESEYEKEFISKIEDSFNIPEALAVLWQVVNDDMLSSHVKLHLIKKFDYVFGLKLGEITKHEEISNELKTKIEDIILKRNEAKAVKDFETADKLRQEAKEIGFELLDTPEGTKYKKFDLVNE